MGEMYVLVYCIFVEMCAEYLGIEYLSVIRNAGDVWNPAIPSYLEYGGVFLYWIYREVRFSHIPRVAAFY